MSMTALLLIVVASILAGTTLGASFIATALRTNRSDVVQVGDQLKRIADRLDQLRLDYAQFQRTMELEYEARRRDREAARKERDERERERIRKGIEDGTIRVLDG